jgi:hypothetical protein
MPHGTSLRRNSVNGHVVRRRSGGLGDRRGAGKGRVSDEEKNVRRRGNGEERLGVKNGGNGGGDRRAGGRRVMNDLTDGAIVFGGDGAVIMERLDGLESEEDRDSEEAQVSGTPKIHRPER